MVTPNKEIGSRIFMLFQLIVIYTNRENKKKKKVIIVMITDFRELNIIG